MVVDVSADLLVYKRDASYPIDFRFLFFFGASPGSGTSLKQQSEMPKFRYKDASQQMDPDPWEFDATNVQS
ncbi:hypothetical protein PanWU01x14_162970 [Parasponia andersonii]|uniref:Uncharacterized protein n=1 Tax=Parasponia andersonii TaxID=3476 RepID=A0A2P5CD58_PARAD|nr:hypothetical protein PanWU01x14_162970 [Parasponia andersonii]